MNIVESGVKHHNPNPAVQKWQQYFILFVSGDATCGASLVGLIERFKLEKEEMMAMIRSKVSVSSFTMENEYYRLLRQHILLTEEAGFPAVSVAVGLAERQQQYKSDR